MHELAAILELDRRATYEFFLPLFVSTFNYLNIKDDPAAQLEAELAQDAQNFPEYINALGNERLYVAWDTEKNIPCGLITFHKKNNTTVQIDLLLVAAGYRHQGIGKQLVNSVYNAFNGITANFVYPLRYHNEATLQFYQSLGFKAVYDTPAEQYTNSGVTYAELFTCLRLDYSTSLKLRRIPR